MRWHVDFERLREENLRDRDNRVLREVERRR